MFSAVCNCFTAANKRGIVDQCRQHLAPSLYRCPEPGDTYYAPSNGIPELLSAISEKITGENKFACKPDQVIVTCGSKDAIYEGMEAILNPG